MIYVNGSFLKLGEKRFLRRKRQGLIDIRLELASLGDDERGGAGLFIV